MIAPMMITMMVMMMMMMAMMIVPNRYDDSNQPLTLTMMMVMIQKMKMKTLLMVITHYITLGFVIVFSAGTLGPS